MTYSKPGFWLKTIVRIKRTWLICDSNVMSALLEFPDWCGACWVWIRADLNSAGERTKPSPAGWLVSQVLWTWTCKESVSCRPPLSPSSLHHSLSIRSHTELEHALTLLSAYYTCCPVAALPARSKATSSWHRKDLVGLSQVVGKWQLNCWWLSTLRSPTISQGLCSRDYWSLKPTFACWWHEVPCSQHSQCIWKVRLLLLVPLKILQGTHLGRMREKEANTTDLCWRCLKKHWWDLNNPFCNTENSYGENPTSVRCWRGGIGVRGS